MSRQLRSIGVALLLATLLAAWPSGHARAYDPSTVVATGEFTNDVSDANTDGDYVTWVLGADTPATSCNILNVASLASPQDKQELDIVRGSAFAVAHDTLLWANQVHDCPQYAAVYDPGIYGRNLTTGQPYAVTTDAVSAIALSGTSVVWGTRGNPFADVPVYVRTRPLDGGAPLTLAQRRADITVTLLRAHDGQLAWLEFGASGFDATIVTLGQDGQVAELVHDTAIPWFDLYGDLLAWQNGNTLQLRDLASGQTRVIAADVAGGTSMDGRYLFWASAPDPQHVTLHAYDLLSDSRFTVVTYTAEGEGNTVGLRRSNAAGGALVWDDYGFPNIGTRIHAARIADVLPTAPLPDPGTTDPTWIWYPETDHYLSAGFRDYWATNGGLSVFGYPLTEEYTAHDQTVQYTERQRFEWHPETQPPYQVLLGRLGDELLLSQGRHWQDFPKADPSADHYVSETGHAIAPQFWDYWSSNGLELGDPGVSYRESVALFGYPLSEPMLETNADGDTVLTQYFERAVFEYHPENAGTPYVVLLRRLGAEALAARGW